MDSQLRAARPFTSTPAPKAARWQGLAVMLRLVPQTALVAAWYTVVPSVCAPPRPAAAMALPDACVKVCGPALRALDTNSSTTSLVRPKVCASLFARAPSTAQSQIASWRPVTSVTVAVSLAAFLPRMTLPAWPTVSGSRPPLAAAKARTPRPTTPPLPQTKSRCVVPYRPLCVAP